MTTLALAGIEYLINIMINNSDTINIAFFGSSDFMKVILENIITNQNLELSKISNRQYIELKKTKKSHLDLTPKFWNDEKKVKDSFANKLLEKKVNLSIIVTSPNRINRGKQVVNPIEEIGKKNGIKVFKPESLKKDSQELIKCLKDVDIAIIASYGMIIPEEFLEIPKYGMINWHPSNLPLYRGPSPIQSAILNGDLITGLSWIQVEKKMDSGDIYLQQETTIEKDDNFVDVMNSLSSLGSQTWAMICAIKILESVNSQSEKLLTDFAPRRQNYDKVTFCNLIKKDDKFIDPNNKTAKQIKDHFRAFIIFPGTWVKISFFDSFVKLIEIGRVYSDKEFLKLSKASIELENLKGLYILQIDSKQRIFIKCQEGYLEIKKICLGNGKSINLLGYNFHVK